ncbi:caspase-like protein [Armillaria novae-zelandiae]|uniref:Caspase-like protein n=1 Tax=Armillaria novae-zelandiae TaxID=153914 RepID=A0AA39KEV4_9AGAR|nr:caspase-like protein [Armillaria novae-zelandiae]
MGASGPQKEGSKPTTSDTDHNHNCHYLPGASVPCVQAMSCGNYESSRRKRALCIGINYSDPKPVLRGCMEDVKNICGILQENGYEDITVLTDEADSKKKPTRSNILEALYKIFREAQPNDSLFLHYSGHGDQIPDTDGDEIDGKDERSVGCDWLGITDDELHKMLQSLPSGCQLTAFFDSCHSGTILDLPYTFSCTGQCYGPISKLDIPAVVICWSGTRDDQTGADTLQGGAMTCAFISAWKNKSGEKTYKQLLHSIRMNVNRENQDDNQIPQLGSSHPIDTNSNFIL